MVEVDFLDAGNLKSTENSKSRNLKIWESQNLRISKFRKPKSGKLNVQELKIW